MFSLQCSGWAAPDLCVGLSVIIMMLDWAMLPQHKEIIRVPNRRTRWAPGWCIWLLSVHPGCMVWWRHIAGFHCWPGLESPATARLCCECHQCRPGLGWCLLLQWDPSRVWRAPSVSIVDSGVTYMQLLQWESKLIPLRYREVYICIQSL